MNTSCAWACAALLLVGCSGSGSGGSTPAGGGTGALGGSGATGGTAASGGSGAAGGCGPGGPCEGMGPMCCDLDTGATVPSMCAGCGWSCPANAMSCAAPNFCTGSASCAADEYCSHVDANCQGFGVCKKRPTSCPPDPHPVCTCDGTIATNECEAQAAGQTLGTDCTAPAGELPCGPYFCSSATEACERVDGMPDQYDCITPAASCPALACSCFYAQGCFSDCWVDDNGGITLRAVATASTCLPTDLCCSASTDPGSTPCSCTSNASCQPSGTQVSDCPAP